MRHTLTCRCEGCLDDLFDRWIAEARQGLRCSTCFAVPKVHLRNCTRAGDALAPAMATNGQVARQRAAAARA